MNSFGICTWGVVPVRGEARHASEQVTQLVFGDLYQIMDNSAEKNWLAIRTCEDGYEGWIDSKQFYAVSESFANAVLAQTQMRYFVKSEIGFLAEANAQPVLLPLGASLPFFQAQNKTLLIDGKVFHFQGQFTQTYQQFNVVELIRWAEKYLNTPYLWGGKSNFGVDCSGFVQQVFRVFGVSLPRDASPQSLCGENIDLQDALPADLAFFKNEMGKIIHVGIVHEPGKIIHSSGEVRIDTLDGEGIYHQTRAEYTHRLAFVKRILTKSKKLTQ